MIEFRKISLDSREVIQGLTLRSEKRNCDFSFANLCSWSFLYQTGYAICDNSLILRFYLSGKPVYMVLLGEGDMASVIRVMYEDACRLGEELRILGVSSRMKDKLETCFPGCFIFKNDRDYADYIYLREELATLRGKKFQPKRNHLNRFYKSYPQYEYKDLTEDLIPECLRLEEKWCRANGCAEEADLRSERQSMHYALNHLKELDIKGGVLLVGGQIVAFTYGAAINYDTWDVCVEKADTEVEGSYAMINYEYVNHLPETYVYINREEDLGIDGLRKAKLSYQPHFLLEKYMAIWI